MNQILRRMFAAIAACVVCLTFGLEDASANSNLRRQFGSAFETLLKNKRASTGDSWEVFFKSVEGDAAAQNGMAKLIQLSGRHVDGRTNMGHSHALARTLDDLDVWMKANPDYGYNMRDMLRNIDELDKFAEAASNSAVQIRNLESMLGKFLLKQKGNMAAKDAEKNMQAALAEVMEIAKVKDNLKTIQPFKTGVAGPNAAKRMFREATCEGGLMDGTWYLEVKHYPESARSTGAGNLRKQISSHFRRLANDGDLNPGDVAKTPGLAYRFAGAGLKEGDFDSWRKTIEKRVKRVLRKKHGYTKEAAEAFVETRLSIERVS